MDLGSHLMLFWKITTLTCLLCVPRQDDGLSERQSVFAVLRQAELVPATVNDYREKLLHLRKLRHDVARTAVPEGPLQEVEDTVSLKNILFMLLDLFYWLLKDETYQVITPKTNL